MMTREFRDDWVKRLRSGDYSQARGVLALGSDTSCRCCLGVAMDVLNVEPKSSGDDLFEDPDCASFNGSYFLPSSELYSRMGLDYGDCVKLSSMNDGDGLFQDNPQSFEQITDYLEAFPVQEN